MSSGTRSNMLEGRCRVPAGWRTAPHLPGREQNIRPQVRDLCHAGHPLRATSWLENRTAAGRSLAWLLFDGRYGADFLFRSSLQRRLSSFASSVVPCWCFAGSLFSLRFPLVGFVAYFPACNLLLLPLLPAVLCPFERRACKGGQQDAIVLVQANSSCNVGNKSAHRASGM